MGVEEDEMRIDAERSQIRLGKEERPMWSDEHDDRARDEIRRTVYAAARELAQQTGRRVEIYAPGVSGDRLLEVIQPEE